MPRNETILSVFVASPSDVADERKELETIIHELNRTWSKNLNLRLELLKWETDSYPSFGKYPQDVINKQIEDNYDIFIAIFWSTAGTPTKTSESGTIEEFEIAYKKFQNDNNSIELMVYFKDQPIPPSKINTAQLDKLNRLRNSLGEKGGLYWKFDNLEDFSSLLRVHLSKVAQKWSSQHPYTMPSQTTINTPPVHNIDIHDSHDDYDDYGILDYQDIFEARMSDMTSGLNLITEATLKIASQFSKRALEIEHLNDEPNESGPTKARKLIKLSSEDLEHFSENIEQQIQLVSNSRIDAFSALSKAVSMRVDSFSDEDQTPLKNSLISMIESASESKIGINQFRQSIEALPRLTIQLNKSKRRAIAALDKILEETSTTIQSALEIVKTLKTLDHPQNLQ